MRFHSIFIASHWILAFLIAASLGLGWCAKFIPRTNNELRDFIFEFHTSLGLTSAIVVLVMAVSRVAYKPPPLSKEFSRWQKILSSASSVLLYISIIVMLMSGYLRAAYGGTPVEFWGVNIPSLAAADRPFSDLLGGFWGAPLRMLGAEITCAELSGLVHSATAFALAGLIVIHIGSTAVNSFRFPGAGGMLTLRPPELPSREQLPPQPAFPAGQRLANDLRLFGWLGFSLQLTFAIVTALLLEFATSGRAFSPSVAGFGDAIYWGIDGFLLLLLAVCVAFYYTRAACHIRSAPRSYFSKTSVRAFWFLLAGLLLGLLGILISFTGVALSISLLIAKTVSQPPGIAITDPSKIVRALDVFVLLVNFLLLMSHFMGSGIALWLVRSASRARFRYIAGAQ